jgi:hypothetical protein
MIFSHITSSLSFFVALNQPYVHAYDSVTPFRIPGWIEETIDTRNVVTVSKEALVKIQDIKGQLKQYKDEPEQYMQGR